jgi:hypothetical protein
VLISLVLGALIAGRITRRIGAALNADLRRRGADGRRLRRAAAHRQPAGGLGDETTTTMDELATSAKRSNEQAKGSLAMLEEVAARPAKGATGPTT